ncbi:MAG: hypothetical protein GEEBNDBF_02509 [bacterium]|nr:hypothetical protein [bacterium]
MAAACSVHSRRPGRESAGVLFSSVRLWFIPTLAVCCWLLSPALWAAEATYRLASSAVEAPERPRASPESLVAQELAQLQLVEVAGDTLVYDEAAQTASWRGDVRLTAGSIELTTEALTLTFIADPAGGEPLLDTLAAGPVMEIRVRQNLVVVRGEELSYAFQSGEGQVLKPAIELLLPEDLLKSLGDIPLSLGDVQTTVYGDRVAIAENQVLIEGASVTLLAEGRQDFKITARSLEVFNPYPDVTQLRTKNLRIQLAGWTVVRLPWTQTFTVDGEVSREGWQVDFPRFVSADEGIGVQTAVHYDWLTSGADAREVLALGVAFEGIFDDRTYWQPYAAFRRPDLGELRLKWGTERGISALDDRSLAVETAPELVWQVPVIGVGDWLSLRPEIGAGRIEERVTARTSDRLRGTIRWSTPRLPLGSPHFTAQLRGLADQRYYDQGFEQTILEGGVVLQYVEPGEWGTQVSWMRRDDQGFSPFLHDRLRLREEAAFRQKVIGPDGWSGLLRGRYDIEESRWRTFELGFGKELELLEARLFWDTIRDGVRFELGYVGEI